MPDSVLPDNSSHITTLVHKNASLVTTITAALINLIIIIILNYPEAGFPANLQPFCRKKNLLSEDYFGGFCHKSLAEHKKSMTSRH
ncbi:hypothetical protein ACOMHN_020038 [Nucella lapillus]